ncbi:50S ribosomal protein L9 [Rhodospirillum rubrum]|uniref:50S ribosomal protein L9 n=1 Tax=Rhodospirillum rubrum TaxID=1085 RepID=UPI0019035B00|nr:50S ribosomal protein L9 [Rhodospirillum rubrum]
MEVILLERIENLGFMGDIVKVKDGYARNFLLPQKKALRKSKSNLEYFNTQKVELEALNLKRKGEAEAVAVKLDGLNLVMVRQAGESGQLYGSVSARDITDSLKAEGFVIARSQVLLNHPIKDLGRYETRVSLHPEVIVTITVVVARSEAEAQAQASAAAAAAAALLERPEDAEEAPVNEEEAEAALLDDEDADEYEQG